MREVLRVNPLWKAFIGIISWIASAIVHLRRRRDHPLYLEVILSKLEAYRDAACDLSVAKSELSHRNGADAPSGADVGLAVAEVQKVLADEMALFAVGSVAAFQHGPVSTKRRKPSALTARKKADLAEALYHNLFRLIEQARIDMIRRTPPHPLNPDEVIPKGFLTEPSAELRVLADNLEEAFRADVDLGRSGHVALSRLLARVASKREVADALCTQDDIGNWRSGGESLRSACVFGEIFRLWSLIAQELVCPGVTDEMAIGVSSDPRDVLLMTDPVTRARYEREGRLEELKDDIRFEVMRGKPWELTDLQYLEEVTRLESTGALKRLASYWNTSPHPPIFRAQRSGTLLIGGRTYHFHRGQDIVWACQMVRERAGTNGPVLIDKFDSTRITRLCGEMPNAVLGSHPGPAAAAGRVQGGAL